MSESELDLEFCLWIYSSVSYGTSIIAHECLLSYSTENLKVYTCMLLTCSGCLCRYDRSIEMSEAIVAAKTTLGLPCSKRDSLCICINSSVSCLYHSEATVM